MIGLLVTNVGLLQDGNVYQLTLGCQVLFYVLGMAGLAAEKLEVRLPLASQVFSFLVANAGFFLGVFKALTGYQVTRYGNRG